MKNPTQLVVIETNGDSANFHRYEGKKHYGTLGIDTNSVESKDQLKEIIEDYRLHGNAIYGWPEEPPEPEAA